METCPYSATLPACLQVFVGFAMSLGARIPQIWLNVQRGNTGELSLLTCGLSCAGNVVRLFTTLVLTNDVVLLAGTGVQALLNGVLTWQCLATEIASRKHLDARSPKVA
jgi:PQ loop repeat